ncbi:hypothetical protein GCM10010174_35590 [Kutzneria viridogrisea]|uniref:DUF2510 domain-containing protein n=2 Tax=Kutzneria TaxID=43356 RepID=A0ABR6BLJ4_9PSEU|nr:hypothetical protein [Kutzneria albida]AHH94898.1 putative membrane protein [Kutzneria albida DSM 43870]MBA8927770.1 hypothetical protein [Kutzneria viridogrisea]
MNAVDTILVLALIPLAIYGVIALLTLWPKFARTPRYQPGQEWGYAPVWWTANPAGLGSAHTHPAHDSAGQEQAGEPAATAKGGARGSW